MIEVEGPYCCIGGETWSVFVLDRVTEDRSGSSWRSPGADKDIGGAC